MPTSRKVMKNNLEETRMNSPRQKDLRKGRFSQANNIYHVTITTLNRRSIFKEFNHARNLIKHIKVSDELGYSSTLAFVVMPNHLHWLFQLNQNKSLSKTVQSLKIISAKTIGAPIWQAGYYDHTVRKQDDIQVIARYIIANPIRAGLVNRVGDYPHWDAVWIM